MDKPDDFTESHTARMVRKFGSLEAFESIKRSHGLIPRGNEAGLTSEMGWVYGEKERGLDARVQSSTLKAHSLIEYVDEIFGEAKREELYGVMNRKHFTERGVLNNGALLLDALKEIGIAGEDFDSAAAFIAEPSKAAKRVLQKYQKVLQLGIHSIPTLIVDGRFVLNGARGKSEVLQALEQAAAAGNQSKRIFE